MAPKSNAAGKRAVQTEFTKPPDTAKQSRHTSKLLKNEIYKCVNMQTKQFTGLYYLNMKLPFDYKTADGPTMAEAFTARMDIGSANFNPAREMDGKRGEKWTLPPELKVKVKTRRGYDQAIEIWNDLLGYPLAPTLNMEELESVELKLEVRNMAWALEGDTVDIEPWLKAAVACEWVSGQKALMVPFDDEDDKAIVRETIHNLVVNKLGFVLNEAWSLRPLPLPAPAHALTRGASLSRTPQKPSPSRAKTRQPNESQPMPKHAMVMDLCVM